MKKNSQKIDLNSWFFFEFSGGNWKNKISSSGSFLQKNCIFSPNVLQKKKCFSLSFGQKWKTIRKWKKVPFFNFPHKAWGEYYETPCIFQGVWQNVYENLFCFYLLQILFQISFHTPKIVFTILRHSKYLTIVKIDYHFSRLLGTTKATLSASNW